ncbi:alpha/beta fold hydrolase [Sphaerisporangium fuscum]|uniref:alpha/beta fold hydrolase n=1 Tax=Sphaerisporangium fuscum TaxID=2835868 RepID=UPI001BDD44A2|nr:alpha/beta hydrolase [Sphaerisporangium fuscum]
MGRHYEVQGRRLFLHRSGSGGPAVVFLPGASAVGLDYLNLHERVAEFTTSVLYDRAGTGWSDPAELPRTAAEVATELRELLRAAGVPAPYVLVPHSLGGAYARRFIQLFPEEVAGVVYLDAFYEEWDIHMIGAKTHLKPQPVPGDLMLRLVAFLSRGLYKKMFATWPGEIRQALLAKHTSVESQRAGAEERSNMPELRDELKAAGQVPDKPLIALAALGIDTSLKFLMSKQALREMTEGKTRLYQALGASVQDGQTRVLPDARHSTIHIDAPDAVLRAIDDLWRRVS